MGKNQSDLTEIIAQLIYLSKWKAWSKVMNFDKPPPKSGTNAQKAEHQQENLMKKCCKKNTT